MKRPKLQSDKVAVVCARCGWRGNWLCPRCGARAELIVPQQEKNDKDRGLRDLLQRILDEANLGDALRAEIAARVEALVD